MEPPAEKGDSGSMHKRFVDCRPNRVYPLVMNPARLDPNVPVEACSNLPIICVHEDRSHCFTGLKLSVLSLREHCPHFPIVVSCPNAPASLVDWLGRIPGVRLAVFSEIQSCAWNVKPTVLLRLLDESHSEVIWVDSDIIAQSDALTPLTRRAPEAFGATEETYWGQSQGGTARTLAWGLNPGREMPCTVNSSVLRVTSAHIELLKSWQLMLKHPVYVRAQSLPWYERPLHMITDQEALTALLGSREYSSVPLALLRRGIDIAQCMGPGGFTPWERLKALRHGPPGLIHSMGIKPWTKEPLPPKLGLKSQSLRRYYEYLHIELTPYGPEARKYGRYLEEDLRWMDLNSFPARLMASVTGSHPTLQEFPLSLIDAAARKWRAWRGIGRYNLGKEFLLQESPLL